MTDNCEYYYTCRNRKEFAESRVCSYCLEVKSLKEKIHTLEQRLSFKLFEMDNGNFFSTGRNILKTLANK